MKFWTLDFASSDSRDIAQPIPWTAVTSNETSCYDREVSGKPIGGKARRLARSGQEIPRATWRRATVSLLTKIKFKLLQIITAAHRLLDNDSDNVKPLLASRQQGHYHRKPLIKRNGRRIHEQEAQIRRVHIRREESAHWCRVFARPGPRRRDSRESNRVPRPRRRGCHASSASRPRDVRQEPRRRRRSGRVETRAKDERADRGGS